MRIPKFYPLTILLTSLTLSVASPATTLSMCLQEQDMLVTAYYSPLPDQERYFLGSYEADVAFNGRGERAKDGTEVYAGMIAAPEEFPFGTRIALPEIGVVGTVHDRGGRIVNGKDGIPRIDVWMGEGEEGLARAIEWGARKTKAHIYSAEPIVIPEEKFDLARFPAPEDALERLPSNPVSLIGIGDLRYGSTSSEVAAIQHILRKLGYFDHDITSYYGDVTRDALQAFIRDAAHGSDVPLSLATTGPEASAETEIRRIHSPENASAYSSGAGEVADEGARRLLVAHGILSDALQNPLPEDSILLQGTSGKTIRVLQRILQLLGSYDGETDGLYDQELMSIVYRFQKDMGLVAGLSDAGAGMVGPQTRRALLTAWRNHRIVRRGGVEMLVAAL